MKPINIKTPSYIIEEKLLRKNLQLIKNTGEKAGAEIILALKAFALWKTFPIFREYGFKSTASSIYEAQMAFEETGSPAHACAPAYTEENFPLFMKYSSHITFNSLSQFKRFYPQTLQSPAHISCGLRINPETSPVKTTLYNPAAPGSRLGVIADLVPEKLPPGIEGLHFHLLCENTSQDLEKILGAIEKKFGKYLPQIQWLNMGGGHLITRKDYATQHLISLLKDFSNTHPHLKIILEPGAAFVWQTGVLLSTIVDIVENRGIKTAMLDISFACHAPDCLEMPYQPEIRGAEIFKSENPDVPPPAGNIYRMGGNSCLAGDHTGYWRFKKPLKTGDKIIFEDMIHYTLVKTTMFNGIPHPSIAIRHTDGTLEILRSPSYSDYKTRMD
jgi:carboxynorspermidine decarboxylase